MSRWIRTFADTSSTKDVDGRAAEGGYIYCKLHVGRTQSRLGGQMAKTFALDDAADFDSNLVAFGKALKALDADLGPALAQRLKGNLERAETLDALLTAITTPAARS